MNSNKSLGEGIVVRSEWKTERVMVQGIGEQRGATIESFHIIHFENGGGVGPGAVEIERS